MLDKAYDPKQYEDKIYRLWEKSGYFAPEAHQPWVDNPAKREAWSMVLPPPNVTGTLHTGHAVMLAIEDILARYHRMTGKKTLWLPGTDHAAIATQSKVGDELYKKEGKTRHDLGREEFLARVQAFAQESHDTIVKQVKKMGASLDWTREAYTLDDKRSLAVRTAFKKMYDDGLIYRGSKVVNWDPKGQTTVSDDEVEYKERQTTLYTFRYAKDFPIPIATTRPETKLGDTAVAVHPTDRRYQEYVGKLFKVELVGVALEIKIVADETVDPEFGTGALGVTPAHSISDWEIAQRHDLPLKQVINEEAKIINTGTELDGKTTFEAREEIVKWLKENNLLEKEEKINQNIAVSYRTGGIIEPLPKLQWFLRVKDLKKTMRSVVESGQVKIIPERFEKIYFHWIDNLRDWNISRQIWFGHRIPVWYHEPKCIPRPGREKDIRNCLETVVSFEEPKCEFCDAKFTQDPDTLDTWFSSGLWTFSTLGWPQKTEDLKNFHPTDVLETGYDILFFWVARMILMSTYLLGEVPFRTVYLHGLVRDEKGRKMSKSLGNAVDPLEFIGEFGADALRMAMVVGVGPGSDIVLSKEKVKAYQHFANKIWNASRFVLMSLENFEPDSSAPILPDGFTELVKEVTGDIESFRFHLASEKLYHYFWHTFADKIIEVEKPRLKSDDPNERNQAQTLLYNTLANLLKLLHPFMPFVTEAVWQELPHKETDLLMVAKWPN